MDVLLQRQEGERSYRDMFQKYRKRVFIAMSAQALAQLNGINVISYYAPLVFEQAGWQGSDAVLMAGINGITYLLCTIPPWYLVDRWGRRVILLSGAVAMIISLSSMSYFLWREIPGWTPTLVVACVMIYNGAFGASWGPVPWLYPPEILPLSIRAKGASLSTATNWAFNWLVGEVTPVLQELIHWRLYLVHAFFCAVSFVVGKGLMFSFPLFSSSSSSSLHFLSLSLLFSYPILFCYTYSSLRLSEQFAKLTSPQSTSSTPKPPTSDSKTWISSSATPSLPCQHRPNMPKSSP